MSTTGIKGEWRKFLCKDLKERLEKMDAGTHLSAHASLLVKGETSHLICQDNRTSFIYKNKTKQRKNTNKLFEDHSCPD